MRVQTLLRVLVGVLIVGILIMSAALLRFVFAGGKGTTPRTELERAVIAAEESVKAAPNDPSARIKLAAAYLEQGSSRAAITQARVAVRLEPSVADPYYILGISLAASGNNVEAIKSLQKAASTTGQTADFYQDVWAQLATVQEKSGDAAGALASIGKAIDSSPENVLLLVQRGGIYERQKNWFLAAVDYAYAMHYSPDYQPGADGLARMTKEHAAEAKKAIDAVNRDTQGDSMNGVNSGLTTTTP